MKLLLYLILVIFTPRFFISRISYSNRLDLSASSAYNTCYELGKHDSAIYHNPFPLRNEVITAYPADALKWRFKTVSDRWLNVRLKYAGVGKIAGAAE